MHLGVCIMHTSRPPRWAYEGIWLSSEYMASGSSQELLIKHPVGWRERGMEPWPTLEQHIRLNTQELLFTSRRASYLCPLNIALLASPPSSSSSSSPRWLIFKPKFKPHTRPPSLFILLGSLAHSLYFVSMLAGDETEGHRGIVSEESDAGDAKSAWLESTWLDDFCTPGLSNSRHE